MQRPKLKCKGLCFSLNYSGEYVGFAFALSQTNGRLEAFGQRLQDWHGRYILPAGRCRCKNGITQAKAHL
jgi:hypothetical protein